MLLALSNTNKNSVRLKRHKCARTCHFSKDVTSIRFCEDGILRQTCTYVMPRHQLLHYLDDAVLGAESILQLGQGAVPAI